MSTCAKEIVEKSEDNLFSVMIFTYVRFRTRYVQIENFLWTNFWAQNKAIRNKKSFTFTNTSSVFADFPKTINRVTNYQSLITIQCE